MNAIGQNLVPGLPETAQWGYFDATREPVLEINSGEQVRINTVSGVPAVTPESGYTVLPEHREIHEKTERRQTPGHILTGPVYINGAAPGDSLRSAFSISSLPLIGVGTRSGQLAAPFRRTFRKNVSCISASIRSAM